MACELKSKTPKHKTPQPKGKTQILQPDLRLTIPRTAKQQRKGKSPTETTTKKICQGHSGKNPLCRNRLKNMQQNELVATQSGETRKRQKKTATGEQNTHREAKTQNKARGKDRQARTRATKAQRKNSNTQTPQKRPQK